MKKIAIVLIGWHYPSQPYEKLISLTFPRGWVADYFVIGHRDPVYSHTKKINTKDTLLSKLDQELYRTPLTIEYIQQLGWTYIPSKSGNEWEGANVFLSMHDYTSYDCILFAGDDCLIINENLFLDILSTQAILYSNILINKQWIPKLELINFNDWLVVSNTIHPGRQAIRGSFEFFKPSVFEILGGKFPIHKDILELSKKLEGNTKELKNSMSELNAYNNQFIPFMNIINEHNLYNKIKFLSKHYRASDYVIEAERGLLSNKNIYTESYIEKIKEISAKLKL